MRARHCHPKDQVTVSVRETYVVIANGAPVAGGERLAREWRRSATGATPCCSDFAWGGGDEPIMRLTLEVGLEFGGSRFGDRGFEVGV